MKKTIAILLVLCLCVGLCACTAKENTVKENEKEESIYHPQGYVGVWVSSATQYEEIFPQSFQLFSNGKAIIDNGRNAYTIDEEGFGWYGEWFVEENKLVVSYEQIVDNVVYTEAMTFEIVSKTEIKSTMEYWATTYTKK